MLGEKIDEAEKVELVRVIKEDNGRTQQSFWLKFEEDVLGRLDGFSMDDVRKVEKQYPFF